MSSTAGTGPVSTPSGGAGRRITFVEVLGRGGFGAVYLADVHGRDDFVQRLAVKVLSAEMTALDDVAARQRDEARLLAQLNHDHIVKVHDLTEVDGRPAVLMEYVEGVDVGELLRLAPLSPRAALQVVVAASSALDAAWRSPSPRTGLPLRVVHRDIKPENLLVSRHGGVKVLDFGVARAEFDREGRTSQVQYGTARFMAPEQWLYGTVSHAVDVYALGVSFAEMLAGALLDRAPLAPEAFARHVDEALAHLLSPSWDPAWSRELEALLRGMLAYEARERLSAAAVHEAALELVDSAPGTSLRKLARTVVPELIAQRRARHADEPVLDAQSMAAPGEITPASLPATAPAPRAAAAASGEPAAPAGPFSEAGPSAPTGTLGLERPRGGRGVLLAGVAVGLLGMGGLGLLGLGGAWATGLLGAGDEPDPVELSELSEGSLSLAAAPAEGEPATAAEAPPEELDAPEAVEVTAEGGAGGGGAREPARTEASASRSAPSRESAARSADRTPPAEARPEEAQPPSGDPDAAAQAAAARSTEGSSAEPEPTPAEPEGSAAPAATMRTVRLVGAAIGDGVLVDGSLAGKSPLRTELSDGAHTVQFLFQDGTKSAVCPVTIAYGTRGVQWDRGSKTCIYK